MKPSQLMLSALMIATLTAPALAVTPYFNARSNRLAPGRDVAQELLRSVVGRAVCQVVPRRANLQTKYSWGVTGMSVETIYNQFQRIPGQVDGEVFRPTPRWPNHTDQFGGYYVRTPRH